MRTIFMIIVFAIWIAAIPWFWHLQSKSKSVVRVTIIDRLMTIFWLPLYLATISWLWLSHACRKQRRARP